MQKSRSWELIIIQTTFCCRFLICIHVFTRLVTSYWCEDIKWAELRQLSRNQMIANFSIYAGLWGGREKGPVRVQTSACSASADKSWSWFHSSKTLGLLAMYVLNACVKINIITKDRSLWKSRLCSEVMFVFWDHLTFDKPERDCLLGKKWTHLCIQTAFLTLPFISLVA